MQPFTSQEKKVTLVILVVILVVSLANFRIALRRSRDVQRRSDINALVDAFIKYKDSTGMLPFASTEAGIQACEPTNHEELLKRVENKEITTIDYFEALRPCVWGNDSLIDLPSPEKDVFMKIIPTDPRSNDNFAYTYISNGRFYQLYAYLEGEESEEGYRKEIVARNLKCGKHICNFGRAYENTPLDKSLEEYENELYKVKEEK